MVNAVELIQDVQLACLAVIFGAMFLGHRTDKVLRYIWCAFLVLGVGAIAELCAHHLPRWIAYGVAFESAPVSYGLLNLAITHFVKRAFWTRWISVVLVTAGFPFYLYWSGSDATQLESVAVIDFLMCIQTFCTSWVLLRSQERSTASARFTLAAFFKIFGFISLYRAAAVAFFHRSADELIPALEIVSASVYIVAVSVLPLNLIWMMNARMRHELKTESLIDPLTGLLNRRGFAEAAQRELARFWRGHRDFAVAVADIDHFKQLNDAYGHACGDEALCLVARFFADELRQSDIVSRTGGEEFTLFLPDTPLDEMFAVLDRLRTTLERRTMRLDKDIEVKITVSVGLTNSAGRRDVHLEQLQREADKAMYAAKRDGRNRTVCFAEFSPGGEAEEPMALPVSAG